MKIETKEKKIVEVPESKIYTFPKGLLGFERYKSYALIESEYEPFVWLQSIDDKEAAFLLLDPFLVCQDYEVDIDDNALKELEVSSPEDIIIMSIITIGASSVTANFLGPVVINKVNNKCMQVVLNDNRWSTKFDIMEGLKKKAAATAQTNNLEVKAGRGVC